MVLGCLQNPASPMVGGMCVFVCVWLDKPSFYGMCQQTSMMPGMGLETGLPQ